MWHWVYAVTVAVVAGGVLAQFPQPLAPQGQATSLVRPVDCADHLLHGATTSGVYEIFPFTCTCGRPVLVWCDMETDGGGWTVFLNRQSQTYQSVSQLDFNVTWDTYKAGFGSPYEEYYLGNELLHQMTYSRAYAVRLDMELASGGYDYATYQSFKVSSEDTRYTASVSGTTTGSSSVTYCFRYMNGRAFTTLDRNSYSSNCAATQGGAWWYYNCRYFNPTSTYNNTLAITCYGTSIRSVTQLQMKLRPSICDASFKTIHLNDKNCGCKNSATDNNTTTTTTPSTSTTTTSTAPTSTTTTSTPPTSTTTTSTPPTSTTTPPTTTSTSTPPTTTTTSTPPTTRESRTPTPTPTTPTNTKTATHFSPTFVPPATT